MTICLTYNYSGLFSPGWLGNFKDTITKLFLNYHRQKHLPLTHQPQVEVFYARNSHFILAFTPDLPLLTPRYSGQGSGLSHQAPAADCAWQAPDLQARGHPSAHSQQRLFVWPFS